MHTAIQRSCDVYFYETARRIGIDKIADMAKRLGLGALTGVDLVGERPGLVPTREWKKATFGQSWQQGETVNTGIGQGFLLATPLQLAVMVSRIANGGKAVTPCLVRKSSETGLIQAAATKVEVPSLGISPASLQVVLSGMNAVVNEQGGTAFSERIKEPGWAMGGKTGSAQVRRITTFEREHKKAKTDDRPWAERDNALFIAFAPVDAPRYACAVVVDHGLHGASAAAPVAHDLLLEAQRRDPLSGRPPEPVARSTKGERQT